MVDKLSRIGDKSTPIKDTPRIAYWGNDRTVENPDSPAMPKGDWKQRLNAAWETTHATTKVSMRQVSIAAKCGPGYLHRVLKTDYEPTLSRFIRLCGALNVSATYVLYGVEMTGRAEQLLKLFAELPEEKQNTALSVLAAMHAPK